MLPQFTTSTLRMGVGQSVNCTLTSQFPFEHAGKLTHNSMIVYQAGKREPAKVTRKSVSSMCPSCVQTLSKHVQAPYFAVQACKKRFGKVYKLQHDRVQAFRPTGLFIILKGGRTQLWQGAATPSLSTLAAHL